MRPRSKLESLVATYPSVLIGYSGGVDSALLAVVARQVLGRERAVAAMGISPSYPAKQRAQAVAVAQEFDLQLLEVHTGELDDPRYAANPTNRCFFCKQELWAKLTRIAHERSIAVVADGTNADDLGEHRPGLAAAVARGIRSPLAEVGYTKTDVRAAARSLGIPIWNAPAAPCLSSRLRYGIAVTAERLRQVEEGEELLRSLGINGDLRVRHWGDEARIEVNLQNVGHVRRYRESIADGLLALGFTRVTLDLRGYRRGSLLEPDSSEVELLAECR